MTQQILISSSRVTTKYHLGPRALARLRKGKSSLSQQEIHAEKRGRVWFYDEPEIRRIVNADIDFENDDRWINRDEALKRLDVVYGTLCRWVQDHPAFDGRGILTRHQNRKGRGRPTPFYSTADIEAVADYRTKSSDSWLLKSEAADLANAAVPSLKKWSKCGCPALGGRKLRWRLESRLRDNGHQREVDVYHRKDLEEIRDWSSNVEADWITLEAAKEEFDWTKARVWKWTKHCPWLGRKLRSKLILVLASDGESRKRRLHVSRGDLLKCQDKLDAAAPSNDRWYTREEAEDEFGFTLSSIYRWGHDSCPWLDDGRKVRFKSEHRKVSQKRARAVELYSVEDLTTIKDKQADRSPADFLTGVEFASQTGRPLSDIYSWLEDEHCPLLDRALDASRVAHKWRVNKTEVVAILGEQSAATNGQATPPDRQPDAGAEPEEPGDATLNGDDAGGQPPQSQVGRDVDPVREAVRELIKHHTDKKPEQIVGEYTKLYGENIIFRGWPEIDSRYVRSAKADMKRRPPKKSKVMRAGK